jgi:hypothetical protein
MHAVDFHWSIWTHLKEETEAHPLVISVVLLVFCFAAGIVDSFEWNISTHSLVERRLECVGGVNPAEGI